MTPFQIGLVGNWSIDIASQHYSTCWHLVALFLSSWLEAVLWLTRLIPCCACYTLSQMSGGLSFFVAFHQRWLQKNILLKG